MKKLLLSALMLTGVVAMAQEPAKTEKQPAQVTQQPATTTKEAKPATAQPAVQPKQATTTVKKEAVREEKVEAKKAEPAKKSK
jgi:hypothetical protein